MLRDGLQSTRGKVESSCEIELPQLRTADHNVADSFIHNRLFQHTQVEVCEVLEVRNSWQSAVRNTGTETQRQLLHIDTFCCQLIVFFKGGGKAAVRQRLQLNLYKNTCDRKESPIPGATFLFVCIQPKIGVSSNRERSSSSHESSNKFSNGKFTTSSRTICCQIRSFKSNGNGSSDCSETCFLIICPKEWGKKKAKWTVYTHSFRAQGEQSGHWLNRDII